MKKNISLYIALAHCCLVYTAHAAEITIQSSANGTFSHSQTIYDGTNLENGVDYGRHVHLYSDENKQLAASSFKLNLGEFTFKQTSWQQYGGCGDNINCSRMTYTFNDAQWISLSMGAGDALCQYAGLSSNQCPASASQQTVGIYMNQENGTEWTGYHSPEIPYHGISFSTTLTNPRIREVNETSNEITVHRMSQYFSYNTPTPTDWSKVYQAPTLQQLQQWFQQQDNKRQVQLTTSLDSFRYRCDNAALKENCKISSWDYYVIQSNSATVTFASVATPSSISMVLSVFGLLWWRRRAVAR